MSDPLRFLEQHALLPAEPGQAALRCLRRRLKRLRGFYSRRNRLDLRKPIDQSRVYVIRARESGLLSWNLLRWLVRFRITHDDSRSIHREIASDTARGLFFFAFLCICPRCDQFLAADSEFYVWLGLSRFVAVEQAPGFACLQIDLLTWKAGDFFELRRAGGSSYGKKQSNHENSA